MQLASLANIKSISITGCALQFFTFYTYRFKVSTAVVMVFDWYKVIGRTLCSLPMARIYMVGMSDALIPLTLTSHLCLCMSCDSSFLLWYLSSLIVVSLRYTGQGFFLFLHFCLHWTEHHFRSSWLYLVSLEDPLCWEKIQSFSTYTSHLGVMAIFWGAMLFIYSWPNSSFSLD